MVSVLHTSELAVGGYWLAAACGLLGLILWIARIIVEICVTAYRTPFRPPVAIWWGISEVYCRRWARLKRIGPCTVPPEGPVIVVSNHTCAIDPLLIIASIPYRVPAYLVALEYSNPPVLGRVLRLVECIPVRRDGNDTMATRSALRHLKAGKALGVFIEGRIAHPGETLEAKDGATMLALHSGAKVVPAHISGTHWNEHILWAFLRRHRARVRFGAPIDLKTELTGRAGKEDIARISAMMLQRIRELDPAQMERP